MRPRPTLADYAVIAISPALIMALVGSLVFFLVETFYQGNHQTRLQFILAMFVMATVLVARLSIEEGREYASMFALPLGVVTALAMLRFVEFQGLLAPIGPVLNIGLLVLVWWSADRLTWDCTVIDEAEDASGEGLLQTAGLERGDHGDRDAVSDAAPAPAPDERPWWMALLRHGKRPHAPGLWVVYFSLVALPTFGLGQAFHAYHDDASRRQVFNLLVLYVASALGLLVTTSFLGLRRYLRQRRLEMPVEMAGVWLGVGAAMIVALLLVCMLLPRRNAEYSISDLPMFAQAPEGLKPSKWAFGNDGEQGEQPGSASGQQQGGQQQGGQQQGGQQQGGQQQGGQQQGGQQQGGQQQGGQQQGGQQQGGQQQGGQQQGGQQQGGQQQGGQQQGGQQQGGQQQGGQQQGGQQQGGQQQGGQQQGGQQQGGQQGGQDAGKSDQTQGDNPSSDRGKSEQGGQQQGRSESGEQQSGSQSSEPFSPSQVLQTMTWSVGQLLKWLYWALAVAAVAYFLWRYWSQIVAAIRSFLQALRDFWDRLHGRHDEVTGEEEAIAQGPPPKAFHEFPEPFSNGLAARMSVEQLVDYSFQAFEAWAREHGWERTPDQTPAEFAALVARGAAGMAQEVARLAELYNRSAYSRNVAPASSANMLREVWRKMLANRAVAPTWS